MKGIEKTYKKKKALNKHNPHPFENQQPIFHKSSPSLAIPRPGSPRWSISSVQNNDMILWGRVLFSGLWSSDKKVLFFSVESSRNCPFSIKKKVLRKILRWKKVKENIN